MKYGFIYETTNLINGKKYIGSHVRTQNINDPDDSWYLGSGVYLSHAIDKYGKENFSRVILEEADNEEDLTRLESLYLNSVDAANNPMYYNLTNSSYQKGILGMKHAQESRYKMSEHNAVKISGRTRESRDKQSATLKEKNHQHILAERVKGTVWVTDGVSNRRMSVELLYVFLESHQGWYLGFSSMRKAMSDEEKDKATVRLMSYMETERGMLAREKALNHPKMKHDGQIWISKEGIKKMIDPLELSRYLTEGWKRGMKN